MQALQETLKNSSTYKDLRNVNVNRVFNTTVNVPPEKSKAEELIDELSGNPDYVAEQIAQLLDDQKSLRYYQIMANEYPHQKLWNAVHLTVAASKAGKAGHKPKYFQGILRNWGMQTKFSKEKLH